jgi:membrane-associated protease RseP (regulator of RpoE activity)
MRHLSATLATFALAGTLSCVAPVAPPEVTLAELDESLEDLGTEMIEDLVEQRGRLLEMEYRLTTTAAPLCGESNRAHAGVLFTQAESFDESVRDVASEALLIGDGIAIVAVVDGGPFARAGIRTGDQLIRFNGKPVKSPDDFMNKLLKVEAGARVGIAIHRDGMPHPLIHVRMKPSCPVRFAFSPNSWIIPWQDQRVIITVPLGLLKFAPSDDVLAVALSHQLGHALFDKANDEALQSETRADTMGLRIAGFAGYDIDVAPKYWEDVAAEYPELIEPAGKYWRPLAWEHSTRARRYAQPPHPDIARRMEPLRQEIARAKAKKAASGK